MQHISRRRLVQAGLLLPAIARAEAPWPDRPVNLVVPFSAGGSNDVSTRILAPYLQQKLGPSFVVDNRSGGGGSIGTNFAARAAADGYTALVSAASNHVMNPLVLRSTGPSNRELFAAVSTLTEVPLVLAVPTASPVRDLPGLLEMLRRSPGQSYGSSGVGSSHHLAGELFVQKTGLDMVHVPYRGGGPAVAALVRGEVTMAFLNLPTILPHAQGGKLRMIALAEPHRSALQPEIPTMNEAGLPGFSVYSWCAIFVPRGTPAAVIARFNQAIREGVAEPAVQTRFTALGVEARASTPERFEEIVAQDFAFWEPVIRNANIQP